MRGEPVTILLVEDNPDHAELVVRSLESWGVCNQVVHTPDGETALDYLFERGQFAGPPQRPLPQMILLDLRLPRIDGFEVLKQVKASPELSQIPVVILSSSEEERDLERASDLDANHYLTKPLSFFKFVQLTHELGYRWLIWNPA